MGRIKKKDRNENNRCPECGVLLLYGEEICGECGAQTNVRRESHKKHAKPVKSSQKAGNAQKKQIIQSTQSLSPVLGVKDGIIITKNRQYVKLMEIAPINFELRSPSEQAEIISAFSAALRTMPTNVHLKIVNTPADITPFIDDLIGLMREEAAPGCRDLQYDQMQLIHRIGKTQSVSRRFFLSFAYEEEGGITKKAPFDVVRDWLERQERSITASLEACGNTVLSTPDDDYILGVLYTIMSKNPLGTAAFKDHKQSVLKSYVEQYGSHFNESQIPVNQFIAPERVDFTVSPQYAFIDGQYVMYCYVPSSAYPTRALGGWIQTFYSGREGIDVDMWIEKQDVERIQKRLSFALKNNKIKMRETDDVSADYEDIESAIQAGYYIKSAIAAGDDFCYMATMLTITADSVEDLNIMYKEIRDHLIRNDLRIKKCYFQQKEAYLSTLPFVYCNKGIFDKCKRNIMGSQLGSCYPFTAYELNDEGGIFFGINPRYGSPVFLNIFDRSKYTNANMLILGPSGSGKTYTLMTMLLRMRQKGLQVYIIAPFKGSEFMRACEAVGGEFVKIAPGSEQNINIMEIRKYDSSAVLIDGELAESGSILTKKVQQIERFFSMIVENMTGREKRILDDALMETYMSFGITTDNSSLEDPNKIGVYKNMPVLGDLYDVLKKSGEAGERLTDALSRFVVGSAASFNRPTNVNLNNKFIVFDVSEMTNEMLPIGQYITLDFVLDAAKADKTKNKVIAMDEMWRLMAASSLTSEFTVECFKIIRGYGGGVIGATQDLDDVLKDEAGAAIVNNAKFKFFFPMERKEAEAVANIIDITSEEMKMMKVSKATRPGAERKILLVAGSNHVFVTVRTSPKEHDLITTNRDDLARIARQNDTELY